MNEHFKLGWNDTCRQDSWQAWQVIEQCYLWFIHPEREEKDKGSAADHYIRGRMEASIHFVKTGKWEEKP
jgi:hypothetical protein